MRKICYHIYRILTAGDSVAWISAACSAEGTGSFCPWGNSEPLLLLASWRGRCCCVRIPGQGCQPSAPTPCTLQTPELHMCSHHRNQSHWHCGLASKLSPRPVSTHIPLLALGHLWACSHLRHYLLPWGHSKATSSTKRDPFAQDIPCGNSGGLQQPLPLKTPTALSATVDSHTLGCWGPLQSLPTLTSADKAERALCQWASLGARTIITPHSPGTLAPTCRWLLSQMHRTNKRLWETWKIKKTWHPHRNTVTFQELILKK